MLQPGDRVLVRNVGLRGKNKLADRWEHQPYIVRSHPNPEIPVYEVQAENARTRKTRTLHRNLLLPFMGLPRKESRRLLSPEPGKASGLGAVPLALASGLSSQYSSEDDLSSVGRTDCSEDETEYAVSQEDQKDRRTDPYVIPMRRQAGKPGVLTRTVDRVPVDESPRKRPARQCRKPNWMRSDELLVGQQHVSI